MDIINLNFEEPLSIIIQGQTVQIIAFKTNESGNIKFGINAPRQVQVYREEIFNAIKINQEADAQESNE